MQSLRSLNIESLRQPVWIYDVMNYQIRWANDAAISLWEADTLVELQQRDLKSKTSDAVQHKLLGYLKDCGKGQTIECWWRLSPNNITKHVFLNFSGIQIEDGSIALLVIGTHSELLNRSLGEMGKSLLLALFSFQGKLLSFNPSFKDQFGTSIDNFSCLLTPTTAINELLSTDQSHYENDHLMVTLAGERWHRLELDREQQSERVIVTLTDIHARKLTELKHERASRTDSLTGLLNRRGVLEALQPLSGQHHTLLYIDLDGFKPVNDSYGHAVGDLVLKKVARRIQSCTQDDAIISRLGGDEFILIISDYKTDEINAIAQQIVSQLSSPIQIDSVHRILISASVGVVSNSSRIKSPEHMITCADAAMYTAKNTGRNRYVTYEAGMEDQLLRRSTIIQGLDEAINQNQLSLYYQAIYKHQSDYIVGAEALLRWQHPSLGLIPPIEIITAAEQTGKISILEDWIIQRACADLPRLKKLYGNQFTVGVNISGAHLSQANFLDDLKKALKERNCQPQDIVIELTESVLVSALETEHNVLHNMFQQGFSIAIDDFGTGYSSLAYLDQIPAHFVKIDKAFLKDIAKSTLTIKCIKELCEGLNLNCLIEGVETLQQKKMLDEIGIHYRQGFYYAIPAPIEALEAKRNLCD